MDDFGDQLVTGFFMTDVAVESLLEGTPKSTGWS